MKCLTLLLTLAVSACATNSPQNRAPANQNQRLVIPFASGAIDPLKYRAPKNIHAALAKKAKEEEQRVKYNLGFCMLPDGDEYLGCFYMRAQNAIGKLPKNSPFKKLSVEEYTALTWYGGNGYHDMNSAMWTQSPEQLNDHEVEIKLVMSALNKLKRIGGKFVRCDFADNEGDALVDDIRQQADRYGDKEFLLKAFWSTSLGKDPRFIEKWLNPCHVQVTVHVKGAGADIGKIASNSDEDEVLVRPMVWFKVESKKESLKKGKPFFEIVVREK